jgi:nicotinamide-nucleotide amidase
MTDEEEDVRLAEAIGAALRGRSLATAESCTAGLVAQRCAAAPGSMDWFRGGLVAYRSEVKQALLGVRPGPVVTLEVACQMARGATALLRSDVAVSVTGAAGPDPLDGAPPGTIIVGVAIGNDVRAFEHHLEGEPGEVCARAATAALVNLCERVGSNG